MIILIQYPSYYYNNQNNSHVFRIEGKNQEMENLDQDASNWVDTLRSHSQKLLSNGEKQTIATLILSLLEQHREIEMRGKETEMKEQHTEMRGEETETMKEQHRYTLRDQFQNQYSDEDYQEFEEMRVLEKQQDREDYQEMKKDGELSSFMLEELQSYENNRRINEERLRTEALEWVDKLQSDSTLSIADKRSIGMLIQSLRLQDTYKRECVYRCFRDMLEYEDLLDDISDTLTSLKEEFKRGINYDADRVLDIITQTLERL